MKWDGEDDRENSYIEHLRKRMVEYNVPENLHSGLVRYFVYRIKPGHFLMTVLENNLHEAISSYSGNPEGLFYLTKFIYNFTPGTAWGSDVAVTNWLESKEPVPMPFE